MNVLAIETATNVCAAAVVTEADSFEEKTDEQFVHAERILGMVDGVIQKSGLTKPEIDGIAVSIGPGSFTGLRIGLSTAKGIAYAWNRPIIGVSTLEALAFRAMAQASASEEFLVVAAIDARRDEVYCGSFRHHGSTLHEEWSPRDMRVSDLVREIEGRPVLLTGDGVEKILEACKEDFSLRLLRTVAPALRTASAISIGALGRQRLMEGEKGNAQRLEPKYLKDVYTSSTKTILK